jgi:hypothetical protein
MRKWATEKGLGVLGLAGAIVGTPACSSNDDRPIDDRSGGLVAHETQAAPAAFAPARGGARLLSQKQYLRSIEYLLGTAARDAAAPVAWDGPTGENFVAVAAFKQSVSGVGPVLSLHEAADLAAKAAVLTRTNTALPLAQFASCTTQPADIDASARAVCYGQVAATVGHAAFRVPIDPEQQQLLVDLGTLAETAPETGETAFDSGLHQILAALLQAPSFIYSPEVGDNPSAGGPLLPHQLATRLSLTLLGRAPTMELLQTAASGGLETPEQVEAVARQMLATPEAKEAYWDLVEEWFLLDKFDEQFRPSFPQFNDALKADMKEEAKSNAIDVAVGTPEFSTTPIPIPQIYSSQPSPNTQLLANNN